MDRYHDALALPGAGRNRGSSILPKHTANRETAMTTRTATANAGAGIETALAAAEERYREVTARLASPGVHADPAELRRLSSAHAELEPLMDAGGRHRQLGERLAEAIEMESDPDPEVAELAAEEAAEMRAELELVTDEIRRRLIPRDPNDDRNVLLEVRAGTGGEEAALFAREVFRMYEQYARSNGFRVDVVSSQESPVGGIKEIVSVIEGKGAFNRLKFESGVHRVQRVPATEASGRIHTSAVTVAVLPEAEDVEIQIDPKDLRVDTFCSSGPGGQSVNTTYSAVRITHLPSGLVVSCQDEKSQIKNKAKALRVLKSRLLEVARREQQAQVAEARRGQVGRGDRSEKIRTYNFKENRITDHRIALTLHSLPNVLGGELDPLIEPLHAQEQSERLKALNL